MKTLLAFVVMVLASLAAGYVLDINCPQAGLDFWHWYGISLGGVIIVRGANFADWISDNWD